MKMKTITINILSALILSLVIILCFTSCNITQDRNSSDDYISVSTSEEISTKRNETAIKPETTIDLTPVIETPELAKTLYDNLPPKKSICWK